MRPRLYTLLLLLVLTCPAVSAQAQGNMLKIVFIDGGERHQSQTVLSALQEQGVSRIDVVVATHPHADHIGGLINMIGSVEVGQVIDSGQRHTTQTFSDYEQIINSKNVPRQAIHEGQTIDLDPAVSMLVLNPDDTVPVGAHDEDNFNNNSVAIRLDYGDFSVIFPGDIENETEGSIATEKDLDVDVMLASHHGSGGSNTSVYLQDVTPEVVVICAGEDNPYGHPHPEALQRIDLADPQYVFRTDVDGTIVLESDGSSKYTITTAESNRAVVVPEFENAAVITGASIFVLMALAGRKWKPRLG